MSITSHQARAAYRALRVIAFYDVPLPSRVIVIAKPLRHAWGYFTAPNRIEIDTRIESGDQLLRVVAHELVHASLETTVCDHHVHDANFTALSQIICERMAWKGKL